ncbi:MAG: hypothetical protein AB7U34_05845 [Novosphingobium sp.]
MKKSPPRELLPAILFEAKVNLTPLDARGECIRRKLRNIARREIAMEEVFKIHPRGIER